MTIHTDIRWMRVLRWLRAAVQGTITTNPPIRVDTYHLTLQSQTRQVQVPWGIWVRTRPAGIMINHHGKREYRRIGDYTRCLQWIMVGVAMLISYAARILHEQQKERQS